MPRKSTGSQRQSGAKSGSFNKQTGRTGLRGYFLRAVERGAARGEMRAYGKSINAVVATGAGVEIATIHNVPLSQRREIMEHWSLVQDVLKADSPAERARAEKALAKFTRAHPNTGGATPGEFAGDIDDIVDAYESDPDEFSDDNRYPKET